MPSTALVQKKKASVSTLSSYSALRLKVKERLLLGRKRIEEEQARTYWEVGRMINAHIQIHDGRAEYGRHVIERLAEDIEVDPTVLWKIAQFPEAFPILARGRVLPWSYYRVLLAVADDKRRRALAEQAYREHWTKEELEAQIHKLKNLPTGSGRTKKFQSASLQTPTLGAFYTYRIFQPKSVDANTKPALKIDLGFHVYVDLDFIRTPPGLKEGDVVRAEPPGVGAALVAARRGEQRAGTSPAPTIFKKGNATDLFTYRAVVEDVTDGDTLRVQVDLGLGMWVRQYLRLAQIDAPELKTKAGQTARAFVLREIRRSPVVTLRTTKHDKFDRYLADVFLADGTYLNQRILDSGHAARLTM